MRGGGRLFPSPMLRRWLFGSASTSLLAANLLSTGLPRLGTLRTGWPRTNPTRGQVAMRIMDTFPIHPSPHSTAPPLLVPRPAVTSLPFTCIFRVRRLGWLSEMWRDSGRHLEPGESTHQPPTCAFALPHPQGCQTQELPKSAQALRLKLEGPLSWKSKAECVSGGTGRLRHPPNLASSTELHDSSQQTLRSCLRPAKKRPATDQQASARRVLTETMGRFCFA
mmetsp:Transcript_20325/g.50817  ORF Transcript_20325/g.50817 Transcript_20325/m.50817 type:complete len:223 (+) Transcript_20325:247-915(+)